MENTNLTYALAPTRVNKGNLRETFFLNQIKAAPWRGSFAPVISYSDQTDFLVDTFAQQYLFEIGGKNKGAQQIQGLENAYVVADDIETGFDRKIPLWLFGFSH